MSLPITNVHKLSEEVAYLQNEVKKIAQFIDAIDSDIENLKDLLEDVCHERHDRIKIPHRCPICNGTTFDIDDILCLPCDGKGIVWV